MEKFYNKICEDFWEELHREDDWSLSDKQFGGIDERLLGDLVKKLTESVDAKSGIEVFEIRGQSRDHRWLQNMRDIEHDGVCAPVLDKRLQLILKVLRLLSRKARHRKRPAKALRR